MKKMIIITIRIPQLGTKEEVEHISTDQTPSVQTDLTHARYMCSGCSTCLLFLLLSSRFSSQLSEIIA